MNPSAPANSVLDRSMRRNLFLLACCQAFGQASNTMMFSATALSVITFYARHDLATLPITLRHVGVMLSVFPAALLMQRMGRRFGFQMGSLTGMLGGAVVSYGLYERSFLLMCAGGLALGYSVACLQMYRFAAVELAPSAYRAKAISWVTAGGVAAGILGPGLVRWSYDQWAVLYLATYGAMIGLHIIVFTIMSFIHFPSMRDMPVSSHAGAEPIVPAAPPRPLLEIASQPRFLAAVVAAMVSYGTMSFLMSASPLAIVACGLPHTEAHWVIFLHVMGMFVPSLFTGNLITRFGTVQVMAWGCVVLLAGVTISLSGLTEWHFRAALALNGLGWNFLFVGATTLVTTCYRPNERGKVQALNDFLVFGTTGTASFMAGFLQDHLGWFLLNWFSLVLISLSVVAVGWLWFRPEPEPA
ncbi:MAG: MFS transporter [Acetobacteraceae bacterium]|nr:MFS transporter [Acetobacteraceae bacterium]